MAEVARVRKPLILLSNDDGVDADGLCALRRALRAVGDLVVVAPERNQSAVSHGLTLATVLRTRALGRGVFAIDGTPADCVYVALNAGARLLPRRPDLVVSGINHGPNLGVDVHYSGTVAAAREAALRGISAIALSAGSAAAFPEAARMARRLALALLDRGRRRRREHPVLLNVNVPRPRPRGVRVTRLGSRTYADDVVHRIDPRERPYLWIGSADLQPADGDSPDCDTVVFQAGWVSVTPLRTDVSALEDRGLARRLLAADHAQSVSRSRTRTRASS